MPYTLPDGFQITGKIPIDDRFIFNDTGSILSFPSGKMFQGLTMYVTGSQEYYLLINSSSTADYSSYRQFPLHFVTSSEAAVSATTILYDIITGSTDYGQDVNHHSAHSDYQIYDGNGTRAGSLMASFNGSSLDYTDFSNAGTGDQANHIDLQVVLVSNGVRIQAVNSDGAKTPQVKVSTRLL